MLSKLKYKLEISRLEFKQRNSPLLFKRIAKFNKEQQMLSPRTFVIFLRYFIRLRKNFQIRNETLGIYVFNNLLDIRDILSIFRNNYPLI